MTSKFLPIWIVAVSLFVFTTTNSVAQESKENLKAFPAAKDGFKRFVLHLKPRENEELFRVELVIGKTVEADEVNRYFFTGKLEEEVIEGWGYTMQVVNDLGVMAGTLIAVPSDAEKVDRFITLGGEPSLRRYNSRLPMVLYVPEEVEVRYRIWKTKPESKAVNEG